MTLEWPAGFERTPADKREPYPHGFRVSRSRAFDNILEELRTVGARNVRVETAAPHTASEPHRPYANHQPDDPGVVVYFDREGQQFAVPCDQWDNLRDNAQAIAKYLNAKRALERYGVSTIESEFRTQALPSADDTTLASEAPHDVLEVAPDADPEIVCAAARAKKKECHPDAGGSRAAFQRIVEAEEAMLHD